MVARKKKTKKNRKPWLLGSLALVVAAIAAGTIVLTDDQKQSLYYCSVSDQVGVFGGGLSGDGYYGYPLGNSTSIKERCYNVSSKQKGTWSKLRLTEGSCSRFSTDWEGWKCTP